MANLDCYAVLGVLPSAEDVVIRAAYRALAQRYHPDRFAGDASVAQARMSEINAAYAILSDPEKRAEYDKSRGHGPTDGSGFFDEDSAGSVPAYDPLEEDWNYSKQFYPDLGELECRLSKINWLLGYGFRVALLESKLFIDRHEIAERMEKEALKIYFGDNLDINQFALNLILNGEKKAAMALNRAVAVLGSPQNANTIISTILNSHVSDGYRKKYDESHAGVELSNNDSMAIGLFIAFIIVIVLFAKIV